eukprot:UN19649
MEELARLQKELANIEEMHQTTLTQIRVLDVSFVKCNLENLTNSLKLKNEIESNLHSICRKV